MFVYLTALFSSRILVAGRDGMSRLSPVPAFSNNRDSISFAAPGWGISQDLRSPWGYLLNIGTPRGESFANRNRRIPTLPREGGVGHFIDTRKSAR